MVDAPERIFATVNGMSTRLPDGGRQFIGGWSQDPERPNVIEYVRADLYAALEAQLAEMGAENERLRELADKYKWQVRDTCRRAEKAEAQLAELREAKQPDRTGAVKVAREAGNRAVDDLIDTFGSSLGSMSNHDLADYLRRIPEAILAALDPAAPEASQEPAIPRVENCGRYLAEVNDGRLLYLNHANTWQECPNFLTRPAEQAVTEAQIDAAAKAIYLSKPRNRPWEMLKPEYQRQYQKKAKAALKAAQEAKP